MDFNPPCEQIFLQNVLEGQIMKITILEQAYYAKLARALLPGQF